MKKTMCLLWGLLLLCGSAGVAAAQDQAGTHAPPKVLVVMREWVKPGRSGLSHEKTEAAFVQAMNKANWPVHYIAMDSMSGKNRSLFLTGYESLEGWQKDSQSVMKNTSLSTALDQAGVTDGNLLDGTDQSVLVLNDEMSLRAPVDIAHMRYMEIQLFHIKPGRIHEWNEAVKMVKEAYEKSMPEAHWAMYQLVYGGAVGTYAVFTPLKSLAEPDAMIGNERKFMGAMGEDGMKKLFELESTSVESRERQLFMFNPRMSYTPPEWIKADPDFWAPKAKTASAPASKKPAAKAAAGQQ
jgi:hypothetical protein